MTIRSRGYSLIELMVTVGVLGIIAAVATPLYTDYIATAREGVIADNMQSIFLFQEERRLDRGEYVEGSYDPAAPTAGLAATLEWSPRTDADLVTYVVECDTDGTAPECARGSGYTITGTHVDGGVVVRTFP